MYNKQQHMKRAVLTLWLLLAAAVRQTVLKNGKKK